MKATFRLFIRLSKDGEPLPTLQVQIGEDTYLVFDGKPINGWRKGSMVGHSTTIDIETTGG